MTGFDYLQQLPIAYIDPGTGSYFVQFLLAGLLGTIFAVKSYWRNVKDYLRGFGSRDKGKL
jgi:hypothetical protein